MTPGRSLYLSKLYPGKEKVLRHRSDFLTLAAVTRRISPDLGPDVRWARSQERGSRIWD